LQSSFSHRSPTSFADDTLDTDTDADFSLTKIYSPIAKVRKSTFSRTRGR
jgi:hypothetical protein